jgi:hypothetical protein
MNVWEIIEAIDDPSGLIHPEKHQAFAKGTHPLAKNPAYPEHKPQAGERGTNYEEILASKQWQKILHKANQYLGVPLTKQAVPTIQRKLLNAMGVISDAEGQYKEELEALAINLVFELPEFRSARRAYEANRLQIDAQLVDEIDTSRMQTSDEPENPDQAEPQQQRTPADQAWMQKMVQRRYFTNAMIQGSAVSNDYLFELGKATLDRINPDLRKAYGILMVSSELGYWMFPQDMVIAGAKEQTHVGSAEVDTEDGKPIVKAYAQCFPVLIQEIIKGLTELASLASLPRDPVEREEVIKQTDMVDLEAWSMILGPKLWDSFIEAVDAENERELTMHLYRHMQAMDVDQFNAFMKELLAKSPKGMQMLRDLAAKIKAELAEEDQGGENEIVAEAQEVVRRLIEMDDDDDDDEEFEQGAWKDVATIPMELVRDTLASLNANYGRGTVESIDFPRSVVRIRRQYGMESIPFKLVGNTVFFRGHQVTLKPE